MRTPCRRFFQAAWVVPAVLPLLATKGEGPEESITFHAAHGPRVTYSLVQPYSCTFLLGLVPYEAGASKKEAARR